MSTVSQYLADLQSFDFQKEIEIIIKKNKGKILADIKSRLFNKGMDAKGNLLKPYHPLTIKHKKDEGKRFNITTLRDTGDWYRSMFIVVEGFNIIIGASDSKTDALIVKYGPDILSMTGAEQDKLILTILEPEIEKLISPPNQLNLEF